MPWEVQRRYYHKRRKWLDSLKDVPCQDCGGTFPPECMDFDHRDQSSKKFDIGSNIKLGLQRLIEEIEKCDIICANCHRIRSNKLCRGTK